jgi:two-component system response regulator AlgR
MPGMNGLALAAHIRGMPQPPAIVFVTAYAEHALQAFDLEAVDYLTKPVRLERLQQALQKSERYVLPNKAETADSIQTTLLIHDRGRTERVSLANVLYFKAELKYLTVRTPERSYLAEGTLNELEATYQPHFLRIHRNALVAKRSIRALVKHLGPAADEEFDTWALQLHGVEDTLAVSRRQLPAVRAVLAGRE